MNMHSAVLAASLLGMASSQAAVTLYAEYKLGETSGDNVAPQDSSGNGRHVTTQIAANPVLATAGVFATGSTTYYDTTAADGGWFANVFSGLQTDNFAMGIFVRASENTVANEGSAFGIGSLSLDLTANGWEGRMNGGTIGLAQTFAANEWVHLALVRSAGQTSFYVNGITTPLGSSNATTPSNNNAVIGVTAGGAFRFNGHMDEARVVTFTPGESTANVLNTLTSVPEPSAALLGGLGLLALLRRRR